MKLLLKFFFLSLLIIPSILFAQSKDEELLDWSTSRKLVWKDYKARPDPANDDAASTTTYLGIEYNITSSSFDYKIQSRFSKTRSWGRYKDDYVLSHEQGHFDLAEVFARKLNKQMSEYVFNKKTYQRDLSKIYQNILDEKEKIQNDYDKETNHSINKEKQAEWLKKISEMLKDYKDFAGY
jgi:predicted secreted Zn-dependent protease